jgi:hypothetical protein
MTFSNKKEPRKAQKTDGALSRSAIVLKYNLLSAHVDI